MLKCSFPPLVFERIVLLQLLKKIKNHIKPFQEGKQLILHISLPNVSPLTIHCKTPPNFSSQTHEMQLSPSTC